MTTEQKSSSGPSTGASPAWHSMEAGTVLERLKASRHGLGGSEAAQRLAKFGPNSLPAVHGPSPLVRLLLQFHNVFIYILLAAALATGLMQHWIDTFVILGVVVINAVIGFIQEGKAEKALEGIRKMLSLEAVALRDGKTSRVDASELVPGDVVRLESGDKVPADLRLLQVRTLRIEESPLTGESVPVEKTPDPLPADTPLGDRASLAFSGTMVTSGRATGVVVATGQSTELGRISGMMTEVESLRTPLLRKMDRFGRILSVFILVLTVGFFALGYFFRDYAVNELLLAVIGLAVAAIPEGLPAIMTITLALGVQRMASRNAIIRRLPSVETLGSVTVICSDKTGTLTRNEMTAKSLILPSARIEVTGAGYQPEGEFRSAQGDPLTPAHHPPMVRLLTCLERCNDGTLRQEEGVWSIEGDPTEGGLLVLVRKARLSLPEAERMDTLPFESAHKYMATLHREGGEGDVVWVKGAPERILEMCSRQQTAGGGDPLDREKWDRAIEELAAKGQRVLAAAYRPAPAGMTSIDHHDLREDLVFLGLVGMIDPPRPEAIEAVAACRSAGIRVKMITGDHAITASAIARDLGLKAWENPLTGRDLDQMDDEALSRAANDSDVFARTSPENKLRLVEALQASGEIVAMTGDGVNDAPALKRSDVGIAMGVKGTEVTKDASEMVLADDNFATIAGAVREGRTIYDNLRKAILFIVPTNGAQGLVIMTAILLGMEMPITPVQILWVNMVTAVTLALAFSFEPPEAGVMSRPPRDPQAGILDRHFLWRVSSVSILLAGLSLLYFRCYSEGGQARDLGSTVAVNTLVTGQIFYLFNCRSLREHFLRQGLFTNRVAWLAVGALVLLQILFTYSGWMQKVFGTAPVPAAIWPGILAAGVAVLLLVETEKWVVRRHSMNRPPA